MSNAKSKQAKPKTGLARCMELASDRKGLVFLAAVLSSLAAIASFIPYIPDGVSQVPPCAVHHQCEQGETGTDHRAELSVSDHRFHSG